MRNRFDWQTRYGDLLNSTPPQSEVAVPGARLNEIAEQTRAFYRMAYNREPSDCGVRALAVACAAPYEKAHDALAQAGRQPGGPVDVDMLMLAASMLGYELIAEYADPYGPTIKHCTHSMRHTKGGYILLTGDHAAGVWNGEVVDWSRDREFRIVTIFRAGRKKSSGPCQTAAG